MCQLPEALRNSCGLPLMLLPRCAQLSAELQLVDNIAAFKPAEGKRPLMLLPGRPPKPLALEHALMSSGALKEGQKVVGGGRFFKEAFLGKHGWNQGYCSACHLVSSTTTCVLPAGQAGCRLPGD